MEKTGSLRSWGLLRARYFSTLEGKLPYAIRPRPRLLPAPEADQPGQQRRGLLTRLPRAGQPGNDNLVVYLSFRKFEIILLHRQCIFTSGNSRTKVTTPPLSSLLR